MQEIFVNLTCINWPPVHSDHISWSQGGLIYIGLGLALTQEVTLLFSEIKVGVYGI